MRQLLILTACLLLSACLSQPAPPATVWLSVVGTNDVHGELVGEPGGLRVFSGYLDALRLRRQDDGAVLLLDAGDMWQGTLESNLGEGATVVAAYNALGYDAAAIGNHEFDFGPSGDAPIPVTSTDDPRGALKARAGEASFPLLAANLFDIARDQPVNWDNVQPSTIVERAGLRIGIVGVTTADTLDTTIVANTAGLRIAPLAPTIEREARALRRDGVDLVIVVAHAGGTCSEFNDATDLATCDPDSEIFAVARALPAGLVNQIVAGHRHRGIAHVVNGIAITSSFANARAFGRVDYQFDPATRQIVQRIVYPPHRICLRLAPGSKHCADADNPQATTARYEGIDIAPNPNVAAIVDAAADAANAIKSEPLGVIVDTPITTNNPPFAAMGRLMTDALLEATNADVAIHNVVGGIRDGLPAGPLTFGDVYRVFPFDNRISLIDVPVTQLKSLLANQVHNTKRRAGIAGLKVYVTCDDRAMKLRLTRTDGSGIGDDDMLRVIANDFLLLGGDGIFTPITPPGGFRLNHDQALVRDVFADWFRARGGHIRAESYLGDDQLRWHLPEPLPADCIWTGTP